ncbi:MAG: N-acetylneuraminate synthase family protein [Candidatus Aminicenantes bacterium]|nr:MAG: N-acetylneuraminate synthase family protein [Candidatus Aminicenantes bacterium]
MDDLNLDGRLVGPGHPVYIIAEISANHNRDKNVVRKLIDIAADTGFDAVKFQTYEPLEVFSGRITTRDVHYEHVYGDRYWWEVARDEILMPREWFGEMFDYAKSRGLQAFSTVHSVKDAEFIMQFNPPVFKVASIDVSYLDFLKGLAAFNKPIILSTGMHYLGEIEEAVHAIRREGNDQLAVLHCVSCYPPKPETVNLRNIVMLEKAFDLPVGFSDHSPDNYMDIAAVALGACIIEKHVTLDRTMKGVDHPFSLEPDGMKYLVKGVREAEKALGTWGRNLSNEELGTRQMVRRSVAARFDIKRGDTFSRENLKLVRPGTGLHPRYLEQILGKKAAVDIKKEDLITWDMVK